MPASTEIRQTRPGRRRAAAGADRYPGQRLQPHDDKDPAPVFDTLSERLDKVFTNLRGKGRLSDTDIDRTAREIRIALLEADVALPVVKTFITAVRERARGVEVSKALNPAQPVVKIVDE